MSASSPTMKWATILGVTAAITLLDLLFTVYMTSYGLEMKVQEIALGSVKFSIQLQWLPFVGVVLLSFIAWYEAYYRIFPRRGFEIDPLGRMRMLRAIVLSLALFIWVMFTPYLVGSGWFWARIGETGKSITQVHDFGLSLLATVEPWMLMNQLWQYSFSQVLAPALMVFGAWFFGRAARRPRKPR